MCMCEVKIMVVVVVCQPLNCFVCCYLLTGHAVKRLTTHSDKSVSQLARRVVSSWKNHFEEKLSKPSLDVRCDHATTESRETVRKHIRAALMTDSEHESTVSFVKVKGKGQVLALAVLVRQTCDQKRFTSRKWQLIGMS